MFHKLLKYEFTAVGRELLPVYLMMIAAAILANIFMPIKAVISSAFALIFLAITVGAMVVTLVTTINRFQKNLLGDEGYLMFTLPVTSPQLLGSKLLSALLWNIIGILCGMVSGLSFMAQSNLSLGDIAKILKVVGANATGADWLTLILICLKIVMLLATFILAVYMAFSLTQTVAPRIRNNGLKKVLPFLAFIAVYVVHSVLFDLLSKSGIADPLQMTTVNSAMLVSMGITLGLDLIFAGVLFFGCNYLLTRHLNLD